MIPMTSLRVQYLPILHVWQQAYVWFKCQLVTCWMANKAGSMVISMSTNGHNKDLYQYGIIKWLTFNYVSCIKIANLRSFFSITKGMFRMIWSNLIQDQTIFCSHKKFDGVKILLYVNSWLSNNKKNCICNDSVAALTCAKICNDEAVIIWSFWYHDRQDISRVYVPAKPTHGTTGAHLPQMSTLDENHHRAKNEQYNDTLLLKKTPLDTKHYLTAGNGHQYRR